MTNQLDKRLLRYDLLRSSNRVPIRAVLGDASGVIYDSQNPNSGYVFVRQQTSNGFSTPQRVRGPYQGAAVQMIPGTPVIILLDSDKQLYVAGPDFQGAAAVGVNPIVHNASDENANQWTNQASIVTLVSHCTAPPSTSILVRGWMAISGLAITWFNGGVVDLSGLIPSAGNQCLAVIVIKSDYATLAAYASTAKASADVLTMSDVQEALTSASAADAQSVPIWAWRLHDAQTTITDADSWLDLRQFLNLVTSLSPAVILAPTVSSRNVIQPTADAAIGLVVKRHSSTISGANLQEWQDESGNEIARIGTTGNVLTEGGTIICRKDGGTASFDVRCYGTPFSPYIIGRQANGTLASPTASVINDNLMVFGGRGFPNIGYDSGVLSFKATETHSASAGGSKLSMLVTPNGTLVQRTALEVQNTGKVNIIAGTQATRAAAAGGALFEDFADSGNTTTGETDAYSHTITGATFAVNGDKIEIEYGGTFNTGASKTARVRSYFGGTAYADTTALTVSSAYDTWHLQATLIRVDATTVRVIGTFSLHHTTLTSSLSWSFYTNLTSITLSSDQTIKITLQAGGASAATNDILAKVGVVKWLSNGG